MKLYGKDEIIMTRKTRKEIDDINVCDDELNILSRIIPLTKHLNSLDLESIGDVCVSQIPKLLGVRWASLYVLDDNSNILHLYKHNHEFLINKIVSLNQDSPSPMVMAALSKELILTDDIDSYNAPLIKKSQRHFSNNYETSSCAIVPLVCQDRVVGVFNLSDKCDGQGFTARDITLIELLAQLIGTSIGNIKMFEEMQHQAKIDGLTGLANHKTFYDLLEKELWRAKRYNTELSMIMIDVDNLKTVNDQFGHRAGDKIIKFTSQKINECIRQIDTAARYGGDEFAIILPNTSLEETVAVAERIVKVISGSPFIWKGQEIETSVSIGVGQHDPNLSAEDITSIADKALYRAKEAGKNTIRIFDTNGNLRI